MKTQPYKTCCLLAVLVPVCLILSCSTEKSLDAKIPITTVSTEARDLYVQGRDLAEKLRLTDARQFAERSIKKDDDFALGHLLMAITAPMIQDRCASLQRAVHLTEKVSEGEQSVILGYAAGIRNDHDGQYGYYSRLVEAYPEDERAQHFFGKYHFDRQEWQLAIEHYRKATVINAEFSPPYNQLGYALWFIGDYDEAEKAFQEYIRLIPDEPNPYDSYAELLMKIGRLEDSIENYRMALERDPNFVNSFIGIGNIHIFEGRYDEARQSFDELAAKARNDGERRQAKLWTAASYIHQGRHDEAYRAVEEMYAIAEAVEDFVTMSEDRVLMGNILLDQGNEEKALARFLDAVKDSDRSDTVNEVKEANRRAGLYNEALVAIARGDVVRAREIASYHGEQVESLHLPLEERRHQELLGRIALENNDFTTAIEAFKNANQQDPRVLYLLAVAFKGAGDIEQARVLGEKTAYWNALDFNYSYVRAKAGSLLESL